MLFIVSTPIGNMADITLRAISTLKEADVIAAEDTRRSGKLLKAHGIETKMVSYNDKNKRARTKHLINLLKNGQTIALISDAGTPGINDPGFYLTREALKSGIQVVPVPGASAFLTALIASGLPTDRFEYVGFFPQKKKKQSTLLHYLWQSDHTIICYESPYRVLKTLKMMQDIIPDYTICVARELTKMHEHFVRGKPAQLVKHFTKNKPKGEFVFVISPESIDA